ncbi:MAG: glycosyltransferase family 39 protein [Betaproteobacteria bacterium]|nr:glycosyltransferase family 39 protein [Betaproteobacteria bacterium]
MISQRSLLVALLCAAWILPGLVGHDPWKPDEAHTFGVVYEILRGGSWVVPTLAGEPFLDKPPLFYLSAAATAKLFSFALPLHDAARLASGFWMAATFAFIALAGRGLYGTRYGAVSALLLLGCFGFVVRAHLLITDMALLAGFAMAYYGFAAALQRPLLGGFWIGTGIGVGFLANGLLAPAVLGATALALPLLGRDWRSRDYARALAVAAVAAAPWLSIWPLLLHQRAPALFEAWLWGENLGQYFGQSRGARAGTLYYLQILPWYAFPVWLLALWTLWRARTAGFARPAIVLPVTGFALTLVVLSGSSQARELYALPLLLPLSLLAVPAPETLRRGAAHAWYWFSAMTVTFFVVVFWFYWSGLELGVPARLHEHLHRIRPGYAPGFRWLPFALGAAYTLFWFAVLASFRKTPMRPVVVWGAGLTTIWALMATLFLGWADNVKSYRSVVASLQLVLPKQYDCLSSRNLGEPQRAMLHYFAGVITHREEVPGRRRACEFMLAQGTPLEEFAPPGPWQKVWEGARPGDKDERYRLYRRTAR